LFVNSAFVSTKDLAVDKHKPFTFLMDASMLGVGVGFDTRGNGLAMVNGVDITHLPITFVIPDSREGWVEGMKRLLLSHFDHKAPVKFDFSEIRAEGLPIRGFGGKASGPAPLKRLLEDVDELMTKRKGTRLTTRDIVDIMNFIGRCVVAGNVRR